MTYTNPSGIATGLDIWKVKFFPLDSSGLIAVPSYPSPATTPYQGLELPKPKTLQPNMGNPRTIAVVAQGRVQTTFILPPIDPKTIVCNLAYIDLDVFAQLSSVKVRTVAGSRMMAAGTNKQGFELQGMLLVQQLVGHDDNDLDVFVGYVVPRVKAAITWMTFNDAPIDVTLTMSVGKSKKHAIFGSTLTETDDGATESSMFPFVSFGPRNIVAWLGNGSETVFLLPSDAQADSTYADTFKVYDSSTNSSTPLTGTYATDKFTKGSVLTTGHVALGWYIQED